MPTRHPRAEAVKTSREIKVSNDSESSSDDEQGGEVLEEENQTDAEDAGEEDAEDAEDEHPIDAFGAGLEYHTDSEDASDAPEPGHSETSLLPPELLKSRPAETQIQNVIPWDQLSRREKKELRDELGISMRELREEALRTGALQAGAAAQRKRGVRTADRVASGRISKKRSNGARERATMRRDGSKLTVELSGKQKLLAQREGASNPASQRQKSPRKSRSKKKPKA